MKATHIVVDVTGHGFGHASQLSPVIRALMMSRPTTRLTVRSAVPEAKLRGFFPDAAAFLAPPPDVGMVMHSPMDVDPMESFARYAALHADWRAVVEEEAKRLAALKPDLLLTDVPYSSLAAANAIGVPAIALSSLNWADIFTAYCGTLPGAPRIEAQIRASYRMARIFLQVEPSLPMPDLPNRQAVGPVARIGRDRRSELRHMLHLAPETGLVAVSFGGVDGRLLVDALPDLPGIRWLLPADGSRIPDRPDVSAPKGFSFLDLMRSSDAVMTKIGYGTIVEALCNGMRLMYVTREDWPESPYLDAWARRHGCAVPIPRDRMLSGRFGQDLRDLLCRPTPPPLEPTGIGEAVSAICSILDASSGTG